MTVRISPLAALAAPLFASLWAGPAGAQPDMAAMARNGAANQLGILEYCQAHGYVDDGAVTAQRGVMARLPAYAGSTEAAEAAGRTGSVAGPNSTVALSDMASRNNTSEKALCQQMASSVKQAASSNQGAFTPGGMPALPKGMPPMPGRMPTTPGGMPAAPGASPTQ